MIGRIFAVLPLLLSAIAAQAGEVVRAGDIVIEGPWARASIGVNRPGAAYLTMRNEGTEADVLLSISSPVAAMAEVHDSTIDAQGVARMGPTGPLEIPAGGEIALAPGGKHAMLMKLQEPLVMGRTIFLTLQFERGGEVEVKVPVLGIGARGPEG